MSACEALPRSWHGFADPDPFAVGFAELRILALPGHVRGLALVMVDAVMSCEPDCFRAVRTVPSLTPISSAIIRIRLVELALKGDSGCSTDRTPLGLYELILFDGR